MIHMLLGMRYFKSINPFFGVILGYISPKAFPKDCCYYGAYNWPKFFIYPPGEISFSSPRCYQPNQIFSVSGKLSPHNVEMPSTSPLQVCPSVVGVPTTPFDPYPKDAFSSSLVAEVAIFFSVLSFRRSTFYSFIRRHCDVALFNPSSCVFRSVLFYGFIHSTGVLCPLLKFLHLIKSFISFQAECYPNRFFLIPLS